MRSVLLLPGAAPLCLEAMIVPSESGTSSLGHANGCWLGTRKKVRINSSSTCAEKNIDRTSDCVQCIASCWTSTAT